MKQLARQRIQYLVEFGGLYPPDEPATRNFVVKWILISAGLHLLVDYAVAMLR